jgi:hypothetical protein
VSAPPREEELHRVAFERFAGGNRPGAAEALYEAGFLALDRGDPDWAQACMVSGDEPGYLAVWIARAEHALAGAEAETGLAIVREVLPRVDALGLDTARIWLRLHAAGWLEATARANEALDLALEAARIATAGSGDRLAAAGQVVRLLLDAGSPDDAAGVALEALGEEGPTPPELRAELFFLAAAALRAGGSTDEASACAARAAGTEELSSGVAEARARYELASPAPARYSAAKQPRPRVSGTPGKTTATTMLPRRPR